MAKSKTTSAGGGGRKKRSTKLTSDPPVIIGGGSVIVRIKNNAIEQLPSPKPGYRVFKLPGNVKNIAVFDGEEIKNVEIKNSQTFGAQADE
jgi:hypothetical protein